MGGLILGGLHSSSGKTGITCLLLAALRARGVATQPFKVGPDFIDPGYHNLFSDRPSRNLDFWLMGGEEAVAREARDHSRGCLAVAEGVMGLFDGWTPISDAESTMHVARLLDWPVVLVAPAAKAGRSLAASLRGFIAEAGEGRIRGVILNQVSGNSHVDYLKEAIRPLNLPVLGALPESELLQWPERHLGLRAAQEGRLAGGGEMAAFAEAHLDIDGLLAIAGDRAEVGEEEISQPSATARPRIAVARDEAFHFYYAANLDRVEVVPFSPLRDRALPEADGYVLGGGFPEIFPEQLAANTAMKSALKAAIESGAPVLAECGGLMYLAEELEAGEKSYPMAGGVPGRVRMTRGLKNFGYCAAEEKAIGHEFHYSTWENEAEAANLWTVTRRRTGTSRREGFSRQQLRATYVHALWSRSPMISSLFSL